MDTATRAFVYSCPVCGISLERFEVDRSPEDGWETPD